MWSVAANSSMDGAEALRAVLGGVTVAEVAEREAEAATAPMYYI